MASSNFKHQAIKLTGSGTRQQRREFDPTAFTRAQATQVIANTTDVELIRQFEKHGSNQVKKYVAHKVADIESKLLTAKRASRKKAVKKAV